MADSGRKKYLWRHPRGYTYVRHNGQYHRITACEGSAEFDQQYWQVVNDDPQIGNNSFSSLIADYRRSARWSVLRSRTRTDYQKVLVYLDDHFGTWNIAQVKRRNFIEAMEANRHRVRFANYIPQVASVLFEHALDLGWAEQNPARGIRKLKMPPEKSKPHVPWPDWAVDRFRSEANPLPRLIFELGVGTVQRPGDWPRFHWSDFDGQSLRITQSKTRRELWLPCSDHLKRQLNQTRRHGMTILSRPDGQASNYFTMARLMREERRRLDLSQFDLHALRYRGIMELAWANCSDDEIAAISGHTTTTMIRKYAGIARQEMRAKTAAQKRDALG